MIACSRCAKRTVRGKRVFANVTFTWERATVRSHENRSRGVVLSCRVRWHMRRGTRVPYHARALQQREHQCRFQHCGRREGARRGRGRRPATGRAKCKRRRPPRRARTALLDCGGENHPRRPRPVSTPPFYSRSCATPSEDKNLTLGVLGIAVSRSHPPPCTRFRPAQTLAHNRSTNLDCRGRTRALLPLLSAAAGQPLKPRHQGTPDGRPVEKGWAWLVWSGARPAFWTDREGAKRGEAKGDDPGGP